MWNGEEEEAKTVQVKDESELEAAIANVNDGDKIKLTAVITLTKLVNIDLNQKTLTGNISITSQADGEVNISKGTISGNLTVNTPGATVNNDPIVVKGQENQTGTATPGSTDSTIKAVKYTGNISGWFKDLDSEKDNTLHYVLVSATDGKTDISGNIKIDNTANTIEYTPSSQQAGKTVTIEIKATKSLQTSTGNVTITVNVGSIPEGTKVDKSSNTKIESLSDNVEIAGTVIKLLDSMTVSQLKKALKSTDKSTQKHVIKDGDESTIGDSENLIPEYFTYTLTVESEDGT